MKFDMFRCDTCKVTAEDGGQFVVVRFKDSEGGESRDFHICKDNRDCLTGLWEHRTATVVRRSDTYAGLYSRALSSLWAPTPSVPEVPA